ncbi:MAG: hypothetical protein RLZZ511_266 [Cyanobacteriota bacterium]|jgi:hypothetical protein
MVNTRRVDHPSAVLLCEIFPEIVKVTLKQLFSAVVVPTRLHHVRCLRCIGLISAISLLYAHSAQAQGEIKARFDRAFVLKNLSGQVDLKPSRQAWRRAKTNDQMRNIGDELKTAARSRAEIHLDVGIGSINVAPSTLVQLRGISSMEDGSRISLFSMPYGSARLKLRRFTSPNSRFEIETPAGVSGVRGTEFGISVQPQGKTSVVVQEGRVNTAAQGVGVDVDAGFQNFTIPGEPPSTPVPLRDDPGLNYRLDRTITRQQRRLTFIGQVDPVNIVTINGQVINTDRQGEFQLPIALVSRPKLQVTVETPLGKQQQYDLKLDEQF